MNFLLLLFSKHFATQQEITTTNFNGVSVLFYFLFLGSGGKYPSIKKLEHALEDQIYHILRKSRVITNIRYEELGWYYSRTSIIQASINHEFD
jgi:hypothetical protein